MKSNISNFKTRLSLSAIAFVVEIAVFLRQPALFLAWRVPSLAISKDSLWVLPWQNDASGSIIQLNLRFLLAKAMWGCEFSCGKDGGIEFLKKPVTQKKKTRYLFQLAKGIDNPPKNDGEGNNFVFRDASAKQLHLPCVANH